MEIIVFSYCIAALFAFMFLCNAYSSGRVGRQDRITPFVAFFLGAIWPISLLAAWMKFLRNR